MTHEATHDPRTRPSTPTGATTGAAEIDDEVVRRIEASRAGANGLPHDLGRDDAALLLWAHPELLGWRRPIRWLFACGDDRREQRSWPGVLWGVDDEGELLLVDARVCRADRRDDPFRALLRPSTRPTDPPAIYHRDRRRIQTTAGRTVGGAALSQRWRDSLAGERLFFASHGPDVTRLDDIDAGDGLLPGDSGCRAIRRWPDLYRCAAARFRSDEYATSVERALSRRVDRSRRADPAPHYVAFMLAPRATPARFSRAGEEHHRSLYLLARPGHVHVRVAQVAPHAGKLLVRAWSPTPSELRPG